MSGDRELLEAAAKAAGLELMRHLHDDGGPRVFKHQGGFIVCDGRRDFAWNPLTDDGDALRLAVKLRICVEFGYCLDDAPVIYCGPAHERRDWPQMENFPDSGATTRRAIVRAAAAMASDARGIDSPEGVETAGLNGEAARARPEGARHEQNADQRAPEVPAPRGEA